MNKYLKIGLIAISGFLAGVAYWYFIGCSTGNCGITAQWHSSGIYGGILFYFLWGAFFDKKEKINAKNQEHES